MNKTTILRLAAAAGAIVATTAMADWAQWGGNNTKNMVSDVTGLPEEMHAGEGKTLEEITASAKGLKWVAKLGSQTYGTPTIGEGWVLAGTNNEDPRNPAIKGDRGVVMAFDEASGEFKWQMITPKLGAGKVSDWEFLGMCSSPLIADGKGYVVTNRGEVICFDLDGMADGNDGPYKDETTYMSKGLDGASKEAVVEAGATELDIIWGYDLRSELGVFPHNVTSSSVATDGEKLFVTTSNGVDWSHINIPAPLAPCLIVLDMKTGELVGEEGSGIGDRIMHCNWSSPGYVDHDGQKTIIFGAGDGFVYFLDPAAEKDEEGFDILPELYKFDANKKSYRFDDSGEPIKYATYDGPNEIIATPVYYDGVVYAAIGQDPEHGEGVGLLSAIKADSRGEGNADEDAIWTYDGVKRTISSPSVTEDYVFLADYSGVLHCVDRKTGELIWIHDTLSHIWGSTLVADGKVFLGNEDGELVVINADKSADANGDGKVKGDEVLMTVEFPAPIYSSPVAANGVLYVTTQTHLYAFGKK
ncbi:MAG: outer membrane protein assembly factor BamB [Verrucomicrobiales bacterium]|jgi:outer membrane protein assembly factor BamB